MWAIWGSDENRIQVSEMRFLGHVDKVRLSDKQWNMKRTRKRNIEYFWPVYDDRKNKTQMDQSYSENVKPKFCMHFPSLSACYMSHPSHPPWLDHPNNIWWTVQVMKLIIMQTSPASRHFLLCPNTLLSTLFWNILNLCSSVGVRDQFSHPIICRI
jgi:hypothetical protein